MVLAVPVVVLGGLGVLVWSVLDDEGLQELSDLHRLCGKNHEGFGETAPYGGGGPHPLVLFAGDTDFPTHAADGQKAEPTPKDVQLVACASRPARASDSVSESCTYVGGETDSAGFGGSLTIDQYPGKVDIAVYEARTGRPVDEFQLFGPDVDGQPIPHPERHEMGQGDGDAATVVDMGTMTVRRDPQGARGSRAAR